MYIYTEVHNQLVEKIGQYKFSLMFTMIQSAPTHLLS